MLLKQKLRYIFNFLTHQINNSNRPPILVASMGRAGSTLLFQEIMKSLAKERFPHLPLSLARLLCHGAMWFPGNILFKGFVHKTHVPEYDFPNDNNTKIIYIFCKPSDSVLSVINTKSRRGLGWISEHFHNLKVKGNYEDLAHTDVLKLEDHLMGWFSRKSKNLLIIRYEKIWEYKAEIEEFLNLKINLPKFKLRRPLSNEAESLRGICKKNYTNLDKKVEKFPDLRILN